MEKLYYASAVVCLWCIAASCLSTIVYRCSCIVLDWREHNQGGDW